MTELRSPKSFKTLSLYTKIYDYWERLRLKENNFCQPKRKKSILPHKCIERQWSWHGGNGKNRLHFEIDLHKKTNLQINLQAWELNHHNRHGLHYPKHRPKLNLQSNYQGLTINHGQIQVQLPLNYRATRGSQRSWSNSSTMRHSIKEFPWQ